MREKRSRKSESTEPVFDFCLPSIDFNEKVEIDLDGVDEVVLNELYEKAKTRQANRENTFKLISQARADGVKPKETKEPEDLEDLEDPGSLPASVPQDSQPSTASNTLNTDIQYSDSDPLRPEVYAGHHRRMERQERHMQALEKQQFAITVGQVKLQHALLLKDSWRESIQKIVKIKDASDNKEVERKREMAINELTKFLTKYAATRPRPTPESTSRKPKKKSKPKPKPSIQKRPQPKQCQSSQLPAFKRDDDDDDNLVLRFRPFAFNYMLPPRIFPPVEFSLPALLRSEVEAYDLIDSLKK